MRFFLAGVIALGFWACASPQSGSQTHFLDACGEGCAEPLACVCGVCTLPCSTTVTCRDLSDGARCVESTSSCDTRFVCDVECNGSDDCDALGSGFSCEAGRCRRGTAAVPDVDSGPPPAPSVPDPLASCSIAQRECVVGENDYGEIVRATDWGAGARFVAVDGNLTLVRLASGDYVVSQTPEANAPTREIPFDVPGFEPIAVTEHVVPITEPSLAIVALACNRSTADCSVFYSHGAGFTLLPGGRSPLQSARGLAFDDGLGAAVPCVFGDGLSCLTEEWSSPETGLDGVEIVDVALSTDVSVIGVADSSFWVRTRSGEPWEKHPPDWANGDDLFQVAADGAAFALLGHFGRIEIHPASPRQSSGCRAGAEINGVELLSGGDRFAVVTSGLLLESQPAERPVLCRNGHDLRLGGPVLGTTHSRCGDSNNLRVFTTDVVMGTRYCRIP